jgi:hypothetical protein
MAQAPRLSLQHLRSHAVAMAAAIRAHFSKQKREETT